MKTIFGLTGSNLRLKGSVITIGVFDGLHRGHRYLIQSAVRCARRLNKKAVCITFHPHPQGLPYLVSLTHRLRLIECLGIDYCVVVPFNKEFATTCAANFINILVKMFNPVFIFVGDKFRFGHKAEGNVKFLKAEGEKSGFRVKAIREIRFKKKIISSNSIRSLIRRSKLREAERLLGRRVSVLGTVIPGSKRGRLLGMPTANIDPHHEVLPKEGVYAVKIIYPIRPCLVCPQGNTEYKKGIKIYNGLCNIGRRPTFSLGEDNKTIETHIIDFKKNIYGEDIEIQFILRLRNEKKFPSKFLLICQIEKDRQEALKVLKVN